MSFDVRSVENLDEFQRALMAIGQYFGNEPKPERAERFARILPFERMFAARDDGLIVGGAGGFPFEMSVPGGFVRCAGTTVVGVSPTHRRRGVLRAMMRAHLDDAHARGEAIAALWASEETIYGRFGYGSASRSGEVTIPRERVAFAEPYERSGAVRLVERDEALEAFPRIWDVLAHERAGVFKRTHDWWDLRVLEDPPDRRDGGGPKRLALVESDGAPAGYAIYRHHMSWEGGSSTGRLSVLEAIGTSARANAELWRYLLDVDWIATIESWLVPPDHPLFFLLAEPRRMRYRLGDGLWVRLLDVGAAVQTRTFASGDELVVEVRDAFCPWNEGRWSIPAGERTDAAADLRLDVAALGSVYLGGIHFAALAQAGLVEEATPGAIARADRLFACSLHPWCPEIF